MAIQVRKLSDLKDEIQRATVEALTELGKVVAHEAFVKARYGGGKTYENRTYNLNDSYGSAVYVNGVLVEDSIKYVNVAGLPPSDRRAPAGYETGEKALQTYFRTAFIVRKKDTYTILVAAAMWYASMVEKKGFKVIEVERAKEEIAKNFDKVVVPIFKARGLEAFVPLIRKGIGVDLEYFRFGGSRHK